jgi:hypothetical protein
MQCNRDAHREDRIGEPGQEGTPKLACRQSADNGQCRIRTSRPLLKNKYRNSLKKIREKLK